MVQSRTSHRPCGPVMIGDDLYFDVARALHQVLQKNRGITEGLERFSPSTLKRLWQFARVNAPCECRGLPRLRRL